MDANEKRHISIERWVQHCEAAFSEGLCAEGHPLDLVELHGEIVGACRPCGASWRRDENGVTRGVACTPEDHTCGLTR